MDNFTTQPNENRPVAPPEMKPVPTVELPKNKLPHTPVVLTGVLIAALVILVGTYFFMGEKKETQVNACLTQDFSKSPESIVADVVRWFERFQSEKDVMSLGACKSESFTSDLMSENNPFPFYGITTYIIGNPVSISDQRFSVSVNERRMLYSGGVSGGTYPEQDVEATFILKKDVIGRWVIDSYNKGMYVSMPVADGIGGWKTYHNDKYRFEFKYPAGKLREFLTTQTLPPDYGTNYEVVKLISSDRVSKLGKKECYYGESGLPSVCSVEMEGGISFFVIQDTLQNITASLPKQRISTVAVGGKGSSSYAIGAEGSGIGYVYVPLSNKQTLVVSYLYRENGFPSHDLYNQILSTLRFTNQVDTQDWKTYRNEKYDFEFKYPSGFDNINEGTLPFSLNSENDSTELYLSINGENDPACVSGCLNINVQPSKQNDYPWRVYERYVDTDESGSYTSFFAAMISKGNLFTFSAKYPGEYGVYSKESSDKYREILSTFRFTQ